MRKITRYQYQFLGMQSIPRSLGELELTNFFTYSPAELKKLGELRKPMLRLGAALQLGFVRMTGRMLDAVNVVPTALLKYIGQQLEVAAPNIASLRAIYKTRERTLWEHQAWALDVLHFRRPTDRQFKRMRPHLQELAKHISTVDQLALLGRVWLYQNGFMVSGDRRILDYAREALAESDTGLMSLIQASVTVEQRNQWETAVLNLNPDTGRTYLEWLQQPPRKRSIPSIRERLARRDFLLKLGVENIAFGDLAKDKLDAFGGALFNMRPSKYKELKEPLRTLRLACFLKMMLQQTTDTAIDIGGRMVTNIYRKAYDNAAELEIRASRSARFLLEEIAALRDDNALSDKQFRQKVGEVLARMAPAEFPSRAAAARWQLSEPNPQIRALLHTFSSLDLHADSEQVAHESLKILQKLYKEGATELPRDVRIPKSRQWKDILEGPDRVRAMAAFESRTLLDLRRGLRSGAIWTDQSEVYRNKNDMLISKERWAKERRRHYIQLNLPMSGEEYVKRLVAAAEQGLKDVASAVEAGELTIDENRNIHFPKMKAIEPKAETARKEAELFGKIGAVQLPDVILEMDARTGFSKAILGRAAQSEKELLQVYTGMMAHGTALSATGVSLMVPQMTPQQILVGMQYFENRQNVRNANDAVTSYIRHLPIAAHWGDGSLLSADMMSMEVSRQVWAARLDYRRRTPSIGTYTHLADFRGLVHDRPIIVNERQAGPAIDGARYQTEFDVERVAVDTHGYTDYGMGLAKQVGIDLCPRYAKVQERRLCVPRSTDVPSILRNVVDYTISSRKIVRYWDELVRRAASVECGQVSATLLLARYGSAAGDDPIYRAGVHLGRLVRTIYLCEYFSNEELRRTINRILVLGESVHELQRAINQGTFSKPRGRREIEQVAMSGSLTLMTNLCLAWTATHMQTQIDGERRQGGRSEDLAWLAEVSPGRFKDINFRGTITFAIDNYREELLGKWKTAVNA